MPPIKAVYHALETASVDLYGFAVICHGGSATLAEAGILEALLLALENFWFVEDLSGELSHREFREEFFRAVWKKCSAKESQPMPGHHPFHSNLRIGSDVPLGHEEMAFYQLPQFARAVIFLRTKKHFNYASIAMIVEASEGVVRSTVEDAREFILGHRLKEIDCYEENP